MRAPRDRTVEPQTCPPPGGASRAKPTAISWTGGKDCNLALLAAWRDFRYNVSALVVFRPDTPEGRDEFRAHPLPLMEAQAESLGLSLLHVVLDKGCKSCKEEYVRGMRMLKEDHGIEVIATGDMDLVGTMRRNWIEECGEEAGIEAFLPLWKADRAGCLSKLLEEDFHVVFSCVKSPWFDGAWIGRRINDQTVKELVELSEKEMEGGVKSLDLGGERGEYHTMCLGGPLYHKLVEIKFSSPIELRDQRGQKPGERWWTIGVLD